MALVETEITSKQVGDATEYLIAGIPGLGSAFLTLLGSKGLATAVADVLEIDFRNVIEVAVTDRW